MARKRRVRNDRNHIVYSLRNVVTGEFYIGVSAIIGQAKKKTLTERFRRHLSRAKNENKPWALHESLRAYPDVKSWEKVVLAVVRGRKNAHQLERSFIDDHDPNLNTF
jgi:hypothetical protein